ncbi:MAG TPA: sortase [Clostridiales bacterium]|nr:sortase [Clostridiales bacterium]
MSKGGKICTAVGVLLLSAALLLTAYNLWSDARANAIAGEVLERLVPDMEENADTSPSAPIYDEGSEDVYIPDYILNPAMAMPEEQIDGQTYIGVLEIPALSLTLPVISEWSYPRLKIAPCRYTGSVYLDNMVIAAHNYQSHFGKLGTLSPDDDVTFTDVDGNVFAYKVVEIETLLPHAMEEMTTGDWDLTLFTCTIGGQSRVTVRCERIQGR